MKKSTSDSQNLKQLNLIIQSKGGVGKSLLTWLIAQSEKDTNSQFVDLDKSTRTSSRLKAYIGDRVIEYDILDQNKKMERDKLMNMFEKISQTNIHKWFIDMGAPESDEFKNLLEFDYPAEIVAAELKELGIELRLLVVIAGNDAIGACLKYYNDLKTLTGEHIKVTALMNEGTFGGLLEVQNGHNYLESLGIEYYPFGNLGQSESGKEVVKIISLNGDITKISLAGKMIYRKTIAQINEIL